MSVWLTLRQFFDRWNTNSPVVLFLLWQNRHLPNHQQKIIIIIKTSWTHNHFVNICVQNYFTKSFMASSTSSTSTTKNNNYNYFNNRLQNHWMFLKTRHLNWIWLPLSDRSSAIGKTENNIMINPFLLHLFAKPFSISLGSRLYPLPFDLYISLSFCLCIIYSTHKLYNIFVLEFSSQEQE